MDTEKPVVLSVQDVSKSFENVKALVGATLQVRAGEVTAILGQNGAGKSTLMKILAGSEHPDSGSIYIDGNPAMLRSTKDANDVGISIVYQELTVFPELDVLSNLFLTRERTRRGLIDRKAMARDAAPVLADLGLHVRLDALVSSLTLGQRQTVEIARALLQRSRILILDEPNSALNADETERLLGIVRQLARRGVAVIYISHRLEEVFRIADSVVVMGDGTVRYTSRIEDTSISRVVQEMTGKSTQAGLREARDPVRDESKRLELRGVSLDVALRDVSFAAYPGEIVGLVGLEGSGFMAVYDLISGVDRPTAGTMVIGGSEVGGWRTIGRAVKSGIARVPSDRRKFGVSMGQSIWENISQVSAGVVGNRGLWFLKESRLRLLASQRAMEVGVKAGSVDTEVHHLSGGNQQKVVLAKWLEGDPEIILLDDPTRGVDIGSKEEIYELLDRFARQNRIVLFSSSELLEYGLVCDRAIVFFRGEVVGELSRDELTEHRLLEAINSGGKTNE